MTSLRKVANECFCIVKKDPNRISSHLHEVRRILSSFCKLKSFRKYEATNPTDVSVMRDAIFSRIPVRPRDRKSVV